MLVVEDDRATRQLLRDLLEEAGYAPICAANGADALAKLDELDRRPAAVILDLAMPTIDGEDFLRCLRVRPGSRPIPVLIVTGRPGRLQSVRSLGHSVMRKPFEIHAFVDRVRALTGDA